MKYFLLIFGCVFFLSGNLFGSNDVIKPHYVNAGNTTNGDGKSWNTAFSNLQDALDEAKPGDEIWVAAGTYWPTKAISTKSNNEQDIAFILKTNDVKIYGGFPATGYPAMEDRNWAIHKTVLSGDIGKDDAPNGMINGDNAFHVVINLATDVLLDGFTISGGDAIDNGSVYIDENEIKNDYGGGILNFSYLTLKNSTVKANRAFYGGGIVNNTGSSSELVNVLICGNQSFLTGGGMYNYRANAVLKNVTISGNKADGVYSESSSVQLFNTIITGNLPDDENNAAGSIADYNYCLIDGKFYRDNSGPERWQLAPSDIFMNWVDPTDAPSNRDDYRLVADCFAINNGNNNFVEDEYIFPYQYDIDCKPRIMHGTVDLGAFEFYYATELELTVEGLPEGFDKDSLKINLYCCDGRQTWELIAGEYRVSVSYPGFIMTYYNEDKKQASTWKDASSIFIENNTEQKIPIVVELIPEQPIGTGTITISGALGLADDDKSNTKIRPIVNLNGNVSLSKSSTLKSGEDDYVLIKTIQTTDGHYEFTELPEGYYRITADIAGYDPGFADIHVIKGVETVNFIVNADTKTIISESETLTEAPSWQALHLKVYPNPATDVLHISGLEGVYTAKIINILGQLQYSATGSSPELILNIGHLPSGMYFLYKSILLLNNLMSCYPFIRFNTQEIHA